MGNLNCTTQSNAVAVTNDASGSTNPRKTKALMITTTKDNLLGSAATATGGSSNSGGSSWKKTKKEDDESESEIDVDNMILPNRKARQQDTDCNNSKSTWGSQEIDVDEVHNLVDPLDSIPMFITIPIIQHDDDDDDDDDDLSLFSLLEGEAQEKGKMIISTSTWEDMTDDIIDV